MAQILRKLLFAMSACALAAGSTVHAAPRAAGAARSAGARPEETGEIQGKVTFEGTPPKLEKLDLEKADPVCVAAHPDPVYEEDGAVNPDGTLPNVFLYIKQGLQKTYLPSSKPAVLDQQACIYVPHVLGAMVGQEVRVLSSDATVHNVHVITKINRDWNASQPPGAPALVHRFTKPEIAMPVSCNKHPWMDAYIAVSPNPFFAVTGKKGAFSIKGLPPGTYVLGAWTATFGTKEQTVTVKAGEAAQADFAFTAK